MKEESIILKNNINEIKTLSKKIEVLSENWNLSPKITFNLNLVLEELFSNVVFYAFNDHYEHDINLNFRFDNHEISIDLIDDGIEFNPLVKSAEDEITKPLEERKIGGLGIHFVKKFMHKIEYQRNNNRNILTLIYKTE